MAHDPSRPSAFRQFAALAASVLLLIPMPLGAGTPGGPLVIGGPTTGIPGVIIAWDPAAMPIHYRVDPGPLSKTPSGTVVIANSAGVSRVQSMFGAWASVPTALLSFQNDGQLLSSGAYTGGPVSNDSATVSNFSALQASCRNGEQSPVIFDPDGSLFSQLGLSTSIIGFEFGCSLDAAGGHIKSAGVALEGKFLDGISTSSNFELTTNQFNQAITHEIGHFLGLDHSQINVEVLAQQPLNCNADDAAGLPLMFPVLICQDRVTSGFSALAPDDTAWISKLYPVTSAVSGKTITSSAYGTISGTVYFSDGLTAAQDVNVVARQVGNPLRVAFSVVSGYLFTGDPGQTATCQDPSNPTPATCGNLGSSYGSHNPALIGTFDIPVSPGSYTIQLESINPNFIGGSGVGPLDVPIAMPGTAPGSGAINVVGGATTVVNLTLQGTPPRFDAFESSELIVRDPLWLWQRREDPLVQTEEQ